MFLLLSDSDDFFLAGTASGDLYFASKNKRDVSTSTDDLHAMLVTSYNDECIWDTDEIDVLRTHFKAASSQNHKLKAQLKATEDELSTIKEKLRVQSQSANEQTSSLQEAVKANNRLKILCDSLKAQNAKAEREIVDLNEKVKSQKKALIQHVRQMQKYQREAELERIQREQAEASLELQSQEATTDHMMQMENLKSAHKLQMDKMNKKLEEVEDALLQEKRDHERTRKGLEHLQKHFASLSFSEENMVRKDDLKQWTYR